VAEAVELTENILRAGNIALVTLTDPSDSAAVE
jgi:UDP-N-acetyl-D-mannosaminuronate dehydrogenase